MVQHSRPTAETASDYEEADRARIPDRKESSWKLVFERLPVAFVMVGWLAYAASYSGQAFYLWSLGFTPEQAGLGPGTALIRTTPGAIMVLVGLGVAFCGSYSLLRLIAWRIKWKRHNISRTWLTIVIAAIFFFAPIVMNSSQPGRPHTLSWYKISDLFFGLFWAVAFFAIAVDANLKGHRILAAAFVLTACVSGAYQITSNGGSAAAAVRKSCGNTLRPLLVGLAPQPVQVTWRDADDAPLSLRGTVKGSAATSKVPFISHMLLITDNGDQFLLYSCTTKIGYTVEHSDASIESRPDPM